MPRGGKNKPSKTSSKFARSARELKGEKASKKPATGLKVKIVKKKVFRKPGKAKVQPASVGRPVLKSRPKKENKTDKQKAPKTEEEIKNMAIRLEREKRLIMWSGVIFFMLLIAVFWAYNAGSMLKRFDLEAAGGSNSDYDWSELSDELSERIDDMKTGLETIKTAQSEMDGAATATGSEKNIFSLPAAGSSTLPLASSTGYTRESSSTDKMEELKKVLESLAGTKDDSEN